MPDIERVSFLNVEVGSFRYGRGNFGVNIRMQVTDDPDDPDNDRVIASMKKQIKSGKVKIIDREGHSLHGVHTMDMALVFADPKKKPTKIKKRTVPRK